MDRAPPVLPQTALAERIEGCPVDSVCRPDAAETALQGWVLRADIWMRKAWSYCGPVVKVP